VPQGSCNVDLAFPELFLCGRHVASGIQINNVMGTTVGPAFYALNFSLFGIQVNAGHEGMVDRAWLGESNFDFPWTHANPPKSVAVQLNGNDHYVLNTVVFSSKIGLEVNGAANRVDGVHVWFPYNQALAFEKEGVMAFHITDGQNRFTGCYIDGSRAVFEGAGLSNNVWLGGFECCADAPGIHGIELLGDAVGPGLTIAQNQFRGGTVYSTPATPGAAVTVLGALIAGNAFTGGGASTRAALTLSQSAATSWQFNFCDRLVFPVIARVTVSVVAADGFPHAVARPPVGCTVLVETDAPVTGNITVDVDSSTISSDFL
jgi:hypothetical protein